MNQIGGIDFRHAKPAYPITRNGIRAPPQMDSIDCASAREQSVGRLVIRSEIRFAHDAIAPALFCRIEAGICRFNEGLYRLPGVETCRANGHRYSSQPLAA